ncbi:MAG: adenosylcobinamide-GDP ribazoletransferase [Shewanella sp.]
MSERESWHKEIDLFLVAMGYFTRIPMPKWVEVDGDKLNKASRYFGLVGLLVGLLSAIVFWLTQNWLPAGVSVLLAMLVGVLLTGGFHEDGLADTFDGFGGGWTAEDKLRIMKDSRLGSYGAIALILALLLKWQLLVELAMYDPVVAGSALIVAHTVSRVVSASLIFTETYVRDDDSSKSKPLAQHQGINELFILIASGVLVLLFLKGLAALSVLLVMIGLRRVFVVVFRRQIGGYTGDTLGAAQQVSEILCYFVLLVVGNIL